MSNADASFGLTPTSEPSARNSTVNPQINDKYSPLETMIFQAVRRYGEFSPSTIDGTGILMFLEFANMIIEDIRHHPYWPPDADVDYYTSQTDTRPIPDPIIINGLLMHLAIQQGSPKFQLYVQLYSKTCNQILYERLYGKRRPNMQVVDR
ncbi:hypothetical protein UFOVP235_25 [uncultured Caudovirales phage]|uniref:Uncharacterized protein n=1 Tax=uncultured Caudovirales phage TaxID=2100421 RepID=A0A6J7WZ40_9CAUD|nr:hypothetical protein UFOVP235_25 [uncultured Caudovirales phage]